MPAGAGLADGAVALGAASAVTALTTPVTTGSAFATGAWVWLAGPAWVVGCGAATASRTVWVALWTTPATAETGADGDATWDAAPVLADEAGAMAAGAAILTAGAGAGAGAGALVAGAGEFAAAVTGLLVLAARAAVPFVVSWLAGAGWAVGCAVATAAWTA